MAEENISQEIRLKNTDETRNYFLEKIKQNELMSKKHKKGLYKSKWYWTLSYSSFYNYRMYSCFSFFDWYSNRNTSSATGSKTCAVTGRIKSY